MKYICTLCGADFDDDGDAMMHVGFGHKLINIVPETPAEKKGMAESKSSFEKDMPELSREMRFGN